MAKIVPSADKATITGMSFVSVYVDDYSRNIEFYQDVLGLEISHKMGKEACFFRIGSNQYGLHLQAGMRKAKSEAAASHVSFVLLVESVSAFFTRLRLNGVPMSQEEPVDRGEGDFWLQFSDPAGNILEVLGGE